MQDLVPQKLHLMVLMALDLKLITRMIPNQLEILGLIMKTIKVMLSKFLTTGHQKTDRTIMQSQLPLEKDKLQLRVIKRIVVLQLTERTELIQKVLIRVITMTPEMIGSELKMVKTGKILETFGKIKVELQPNPKLKELKMLMPDLVVTITEVKTLLKVKREAELPLIIKMKMKAQEILLNKERKEIPHSNRVKNGMIKTTVKEELSHRLGEKEVLIHLQTKIREVLLIVTEPKELKMIVTGLEIMSPERIHGLMPNSGDDCLIVYSIVL